MTTTNRPIRVAHFADAHIDIANYGRHDPDKMLPVRVVDYLNALDQIVDRAIAEQVDLVIFAGDAYKDRNPQPTFQREWGRRIIRLSQAGIPTLLLVGNHDVSPASGRANTLHEFDTLAVPGVHVAERIRFFGPDELGIPVQVITVPWVSRSQLMTREESHGKKLEEVLAMIEERVGLAIEQLVAGADQALPLILAAHASVDGARYGSERQVMLGHELVLSGRIVRDRRLDYVALGHIHRHQSLNGGDHPPVVYPGSIERIDFGEVGETKGFVLAEVGRGQTSWEFVPLATRPFLDLAIEPDRPETFMQTILDRLPEPEKLEGRICRLRLTYPRDWESQLDENALQHHFRHALSFQIQKNIVLERRARLGDNVAVESLSPLELLELYWRTKAFDPDEIERLQALAKEILGDVPLAG